MIRTSNASAIAAMVAAVAGFVTSDTFMKLAMAGGVPPMQVLAMRGLVASGLCLAVIVALGQFAAVRHALNRWVLLRALGETLALVCFIQALKRMPQGDLTAIFQISPLLAVLGASLFFGEKIGAARAGLLALGFFGALLVAQPGMASANSAAPLGLIGAVMVAGRDLAARRTPEDVPTLVAALTTLVMALAVAAFWSALSETPRAPSVGDWAMLGAAGVLITLANGLIIFAVRTAKLAVLAPFYYAFTLAAVASGFLVFGDIPNRAAIAGIALIIGSGLAVVPLGERKTALGAPSPSS